jgi:hypothetical protein
LAFQLRLFGLLLLFMLSTFNNLIAFLIHSS